MEFDFPSWPHLVTNGNHFWSAASCSHMICEVILDVWNVLSIFGSGLKWVGYENHYESQILISNRRSVLRLGSLTPTKSFWEYIPGLLYLLYVSSVSAVLKSENKCIFFCFIEFNLYDSFLWVTESKTILVGGYSSWNNNCRVLTLVRYIMPEHRAYRRHNGHFSAERE